MKRLATAVLFLVGSLASLPAAERPNIVLIMADDMGYETVSSYGGADYRTPRLDALAASGMRFTQAHSQPLCTPTRVQIMTGQYNVRNYVTFGYLDPAQRTFGNDLREAGYATAIAGKWQLGKDRELLDGFGFDEYCLWWLERKSWRYGNVGELIRNGEVLPGEQGDFGPDVVNDFVLDFIERHADEPFFVYYPMVLPHAPFVPTPHTAGAPDPRDADPKYFKDMVEYVDELVGRVVDQLEALKLRDDTLVIFVGDNGTNSDITSQLIDGRTIQGAKGKTTDAGTRVPLIASWPGEVPAGVVSAGLVDFSDVMPTLHGAANYQPAGDRVLDGFDLMPVLRGERPTDREWSYCWYGRGKDALMVSADLKITVFARTDRYKLYRDGRFYDIAQDPLESEPMAKGKLSPEISKIRHQLSDVIAEFDQIEAAR